MSAVTYLDHAATTPLRPEVAAAMAEVHAGAGGLGNPTGSHPPAQRARRLLEEARDEVAAFLGRDPGQIVFTSGGTESADLAVLGPAEAARQARGEAQVLYSAVEHPAVRESARAAAKLGPRHARAAGGPVRHRRPRRVGTHALLADYERGHHDGQQRDRRDPAVGRPHRRDQPTCPQCLCLHRRRAGGAVPRPGRGHRGRRHGLAQRPQGRGARRRGGPRHRQPRCPPAAPVRRRTGT